MAPIQQNVGVSKVAHLMGDQQHTIMYLSVLHVVVCIHWLLMNENIYDAYMKALALSSKHTRMLPAARTCSVHLLLFSLLTTKAEPFNSIIRVKNGLLILQLLLPCKKSLQLLMSCSMVTSNMRSPWSPLVTMLPWLTTSILTTPHLIQVPHIIPGWRKMNLHSVHLYLPFLTITMYCQMADILVSTSNSCTLLPKGLSEG